MVKMLCRCGSMFDSTPVPEPNLWVAVRDTEYEPFLKAEIESDRLSDNYETNRDAVTELDQRVAAMRTVLYNCPACNRIYWFRGTDGNVEVFTPERP